MSELRLEVTIDGINYPLITKESKESIEKIADYVDKKIKEVKSDKLTFDRQLILTCLNIADDYYKSKESFEDFKEENSEALANYSKVLEELNTFKEEYGSYKQEIDSLKDELEKSKTLLKEKDKIILELKQKEMDTVKLRDKIKSLQKQSMDLVKENEILKGNL